MAVHFLDTFEAEAPPPGVSPPLEALWWLRKGGFATGPAWERAHEICQSGEGTRAYDLVHGLAHWIEGDMGNADYWYRRAGARRSAEDIPGEWDHLVSALGD
jgi:hypothetical protein